MRAQLLLTALLLGCATSDQPTENEPRMIPAAVVNAAMAELREAGLVLTKERDAAIETAQRYQQEAKDCQAERRT